MRMFRKAVLPLIERPVLNKISGSSTSSELLKVGALPPVQSTEHIAMCCPGSPVPQSLAVLESTPEPFGEKFEAILL